MKTVLIEKPFEIAVTDTEMPVPGEGEALLKVLYCGICGADVSSYTGNQPFTTYPRIPGHEFSAQIVSIPDNDKGLKAGDIVTRLLPGVQRCKVALGDPAAAVEGAVVIGYKNFHWLLLLQKGQSRARKIL